jgi:hypothetical protein
MMKSLMVRSAATPRVSNHKAMGPSPIKTSRY